jgi:Adenomatosis polyposis coli down-regulated 1
MNLKIALAALFACSLALVGCGDSETNPNPEPTPEVKPTAAELVGKWVSACTSNGMGGGFTLNFDLTETTWKLDYIAFADAMCATKNLTVYIEGGYELGAASTAVMGAREGKFDFDVKTVTPHNDGAAGFLPMACGAGSFTVDMATDITAGCPGLGAYPVADCPSDYDIVKLDGNTLQFGARPADNDMCTAAKRPTALGVSLTKQ